MPSYGVIARETSRCPQHSTKYSTLHPTQTTTDHILKLRDPDASSGKAFAKTPLPSRLRHFAPLETKALRPYVNVEPLLHCPHRQMKMLSRRWDTLSLL